MLGLPVRVVEGAQEFSVGALAGTPDGAERAHAVYTGWLAGDLGAGCPGAETGHEVVARLEAVLDDLRDLHRGETVVLVTHGGVMTVAAARLCRGAPPDLAGSRVPNCARRGGRGRLRRVGPRQLARGAVRPGLTARRGRRRRSPTTA